MLDSLNYYVIILNILKIEPKKKKGTFFFLEPSYFQSLRLLLQPLDYSMFPRWSLQVRWCKLNSHIVRGPNWWTHLEFGANEWATTETGILKEVLTLVARTSVDMATDVDVEFHLGRWWWSAVASNHAADRIIELMRLSVVPTINANSRPHTLSLKAGAVSLASKTRLSSIEHYRKS